MALLSSLASRERVPELMDDPGLDPEEHRRALAGLARINWFSGSAGVLWPAIRELARELRRPLRVLDVATGSGDVPIALAGKARFADIDLVVHGCDISPVAVEAATKDLGAIKAGEWVGFFVHDAIRDPLPGGYDVVTCSLFLHHLSEDDAATLLRRMADAAGRLVLVNDLARSRFNYAAVWFACHALTRSRVVRFDGPASVQSAFTPSEAVALAERAGLVGATVRRRFPCRYLLTWKKP